MLFRAFVVVREVAAAVPRDIVRGLRAPSTAPLRIEAGVRPDADATRILVYVHYSATGSVSEMVRNQLELLRQAGFATLFVSMATRIPEDDWQAIRRLCALVVHRRNFGLDFGAWRDLMPEVRRRWPDVAELMLANDSVLGPIHPLAPVINALREGGDGLFGLTESLQGGSHLQSYMLLARGRSAIIDLMHFIEHMRVSYSKWLTVQRGEVRLARWMRSRGHRVAALFGYDRLVQVAVADPQERRRLAATYRRFRDLSRLSNDEAAAMLHERPLNPTHHLWYILATRFHFPFVKTELVLRNPGRLPGVADWSNIVPPDSACTVALIRAHLATMRVVHM